MRFGFELKNEVVEFIKINEFEEKAIENINTYSKLKKLFSLGNLTKLCDTLEETKGCAYGEKSEFMDYKDYEGYLFDIKKKKFQLKK